jgi:hypothetical protein
MRKARKILATAVAAGCLAACTTMEAVKPSGETKLRPGVEITPTLAVSAETLAGAAGVYVLNSTIATVLGLPGVIFEAKNAALLYILYDPLAPNWTIREQALDAETYHLSLRAKHFRTGGDGEAMRIVQRRAQQLQREKGYAGYRLLDYSEGIESATPFSYRISEGTIQLVKVP